MSHIRITICPDLANAEDVRDNAFGPPNWNSHILDYSNNNPESGQICNSNQHEYHVEDICPGQKVWVVISQKC